MNEVTAKHRRAMTYAEKAMVAERAGDHGLARKHSAKAFALEREAAMLVAAKGPEPTRSVLLRSAASLAIDCDEFRDAERLVSLALAGNPPDEICNELRDLLETIHFSRHLAVKGLKLDSAEMQMSLDGSAVGHGIIDSNEFLTRAQTAEKLLIRTADRLRDMSFDESRRGKTSKEFHPYFSVPRAASFAVTIRIGRPLQQLMLPGFAQPSAVIEEVLTCLEYLASDRVKQLEKRIPDASFFNNFVGLARKLAPDGDRVRMVGFTSLAGKKERHTVLKDKPSEKWRPRQKSVSVESERLVGRLKGADDKRAGAWIRIEEPGGKKSHIIQVPPGTLDDIVKPMWNEFVAVIATPLRDKQSFAFSNFDELTADEIAIGSKTDP